MNCVICGSMCGQNPHHIITRNAYARDREGYDVDGNRLWLCMKHHNEVHMTGRETFSKKYNMVDRLETAKQLKYDYDIKRALS